MTDMQNTMILVSQVNHLLIEGEPGNISIDTFNGYSGYKPQAIIDAMNEVFGIGAWGFEEISSDVEPGDKGALAVARVTVWLAGIDFKPSAWGQSNVTRGASGDARKGAATDALKKALSYFSIGNRAYQGLLDQNKPAPREARTSDASANQANRRPTQTTQAAVARSGESYHVEVTEGARPINATQLTALQKAYQRLGRSVPADVRSWDYVKAKSVYEDIVKQLTEIEEKRANNRSQVS